ncbi:hypothetical protein, partial [Salmonella enterica]|uniref:alpha-2-macroglobulin family protein n=1 Tax=Salmonella enterica TaxID=28901 RepID=UPI000B256C6F
VALLPAGLELENQQLANASAGLSREGEARDHTNRMQQRDSQQMEFRNDSYVAAMPAKEGVNATLVYMARAVTPGTYKVPAPQVESMYVPQWRSTGATIPALTINP